MKTLAKYGAGSKAPALDRLVEPRRTATLLAVTRGLEAEAIDDALDLFVLLMATRLISPARRKSSNERLKMLPRLERASKLVAKAGRVLVDQLDLVAEAGADLDPTALWAAVAELVPQEDGAAEAAMRAALVEKYNTVRPFLRLLGESKALSAAPGGRRVTVMTPPGGGRARLSVDKLGALGESESLAWLRATCQAMLPRVDLPGLLLEVHAWTGFLDAYVHLADISTRMTDLPRTLVALLIAEACNVGLTPVIKAGEEALTRGRLSHVDQNYVRAETHAAANAILIEAQRNLPIAASWAAGCSPRSTGCGSSSPSARSTPAPHPSTTATNAV